MSIVFSTLLTGLAQTCYCYDPVSSPESQKQQTSSKFSGRDRDVCYPLYLLLIPSALELSASNSYFSSSDSFSVSYPYSPCEIAFSASDLLIRTVLKPLTRAAIFDAISLRLPEGMGLNI